MCSSYLTRSNSFVVADIQRTTAGRSRARRSRAGRSWAWLSWEYSTPTPNCYLKCKPTRNIGDLFTIFLMYLCQLFCWPGSCSSIVERLTCCSKVELLQWSQQTLQPWSHGILRNYTSGRKCSALVQLLSTLIQRCVTFAFLTYYNRNSAGCLLHNFVTQIMLRWRKILSFFRPSAAMVTGFYPIWNAKVTCSSAALCNGVRN